MDRDPMAIAGVDRRCVANALDRFRRTPGGNVCAWWNALVCVGGIVPIALPVPLREMVGSLVAAGFIVSWWGYPLLVVFATPAATVSRGTQAWAVVWFAVVVLGLCLSRFSGLEWMSLVGLGALLMLFSLGAHVLGAAEHRQRRYRPLNSFLAVVAMLAFPIGVITLHNRWRRSSTMGGNA